MLSVVRKTICDVVGEIKSSITHIKNRHDSNYSNYDKCIIVRTETVNNIIHTYMTHTFPEDMLWIQCMIKGMDPLLERNKSLDKMEWLIEDFKLFVRRLVDNSQNGNAVVEKKYDHLNKNVSFNLLDEYVLYIHHIFEFIPLDSIVGFHPDLFDHHLCHHGWRN